MFPGTRALQLSQKTHADMWLVMAFKCRFNLTITLGKRCFYPLLTVPWRTLCTLRVLFGALVKRYPVKLGPLLVVPPLDTQGIVGRFLFIRYAPPRTGPFSRRSMTSQRNAPPIHQKPSWRYGVHKKTLGRQGHKGYEAVVRPPPPTEGSPTRTQPGHAQAFMVQTSVVTVLEVPDHLWKMASRSNIATLVTPVR